MAFYLIALAIFIGIIDSGNGDTCRVLMVHAKITATSTFFQKGAVGRWACSAHCCVRGHRNA